MQLICRLARPGRDGILTLGSLFFVAPWEAARMNTISALIWLGLFAIAAGLILFVF